MDKFRIIGVIFNRDLKVVGYKVSMSRFVGYGEKKTLSVNELKEEIEKGNCMNSWEIRNTDTCRSLQYSFEDGSRFDNRIELREIVRVGEEDKRGIVYIPALDVIKELTIEELNELNLYLIPTNFYITVCNNKYRFASISKSNVLKLPIRYSPSYKSTRKKRNIQTIEISFNLSDIFSVTDEGDNKYQVDLGEVAITFPKGTLKRVIENFPLVDYTSEKLSQDKTFSNLSMDGVLLDITHEELIDFIENGTDESITLSIPCLKNIRSFISYVDRFVKLYNYELIFNIRNNYTGDNSDFMPAWDLDVKDYKIFLNAISFIHQCQIECVKRYSIAYGRAVRFIDSSGRYLKQIKYMNSKNLKFYGFKNDYSGFYLMKSK